ncbi:MAG: lysyl-tRNA synthetase, lysyl-tRNA synthetase, class II [Candidatus Gottesmanbacteria bacterium GW2011_GWA2_43_14]|uniref:Lysine--tRNA ligase n=1 Tax=Candidatus Gottesmanbacteria bacterium GW2011_GWA2_43_14 TaxID=1618443 RepID=A0A0G1GIZ9_9BACT|nr:MAG: lysyl-tRNA synthetase, lysyl-tRNA synthetase, class II [Candidatus Gottesmanbacteria bacterium GW2011_GWA2_43_14]
MATIDDLKKTRLRKLEELRKKDVNPYPATIRRSETLTKAKTMDGKTVGVAGRLMAIRGQGKISFADIFDGSARMQIVFKTDSLAKKTSELLSYIDLGDFIAVQGNVGRTKAGEISVIASNFQIITKTVRPLPDKWHGLKDIEERYRKRYLDMLLNPEVRRKLETRSHIVRAIRNYLDNKGFMEVETPTLQPVYGGGFARPFKTHHNSLEADFYLRISDEMYLKRLIVGGIEKVYEITKVFRNEGFDRDHNPEFTMFEAQIAYRDYKYGMDLIEEIIEYTAKKATGKTKFTYQGIEMDVKRPWQRFSMVEAIGKFAGLDPLKWKTLVEAKKEVKTLKIAPVKFEALDKINSLGEVIAFVFEEMVEDRLVQPTIVFDYPIEVSPLAKKCRDPRFTQRFEMFAFGSELGNNYSELNDPIDLKKRFVEEKKREEAGFEEAHQTDYDYLEAIEHGFPPTCGIAIGIDRLVMLFTDAKNIKEVIAFPTLRPELAPHQAGKVQVNKTSIPAKKKPVKKADLKFTREKAWELLNLKMKNQNLIRHCLSVEAVMRALASHFREDRELWGIAGLLHDGDYEMTKDTPERHTLEMTEWLKEKGVENRELLEVILSHNFTHTGQNPPKNRLEWSLYCCDELTGLIVAVALVKDKKLANVSVDSVMSKFPVKHFAAGVHREQIKKCEEKLGIKLDMFIGLTLSAMQGISADLHL